jgi:dipeptidyl aminopeptidase/acylaminoacyl peptidase
VFSVTETNYDEKEIVNDLWIASADGTTKPRRLTGNKSAESGYQWSPDGKQLAFVAKRDGDEVAQIYLLNMQEGGGEAHRFTNLSTGASSPQWSPAGNAILFTSRVYLNAFTDSANKKIAEEKKKIKYKVRVYTSFPIRNWDQWIDEKQTHLYVQDVDSKDARNLFSKLKMVNNSGFALDAATWTENGKDIIFSATLNQDSTAFQDAISNIYKISASGQDVIELLKQTSDYYDNLAISPDGKYLVCLKTTANNYKVFNQPKVLRFDWPSMQHSTDLAPNIDRPVSGFSIKNNTVYLSVEDQGRDKIYSLPLQGGPITPLSGGTRGCYSELSVSRDGNVIVANYDDASTPAEVVRINNASNSHVNISAINSHKLSELDLPYPEVIWFTSSRGKKIRSLLVKPAGFDPSKKYPLFVVIHGGPAGSWKENWGYRWNYHLLAAPGYVLLLTDYTGSTGYGEKFAQEIQYDPFKGPSDEINEAAQDAIKRFSFIDGTKQAAGGASYGGHLANWLQGTTSHYKCLVSHAGLVNSETQWGTSDMIYNREVMNGGVPWTQGKTWKEQNPIRLAKNFKTPVLVTVGEQDFRVPLNNTIEYWSALRRMKVPAKLIIFPEENHWILKGENSRFFYSELHNWLKTYLK